MKGQKLFVRRAAPDDLTNVLNIDRDSCDGSLLDGARLGFVSKLAGTVVGAAWEAPVSKPEHIVLRTILVDRSVRRLNIGRTMLREIERIIAESGALRLSIEPNLPKDFLLRSGFDALEDRYQKEL
ncbi:MAG: GNAT family N-acetyltransferase [Acidobacteria bacterium]|nr:GNAT family N-acetyltransferase [Acidobacteriota bacterium]